jgi:hypothetical protein
LWIFRRVLYFLPQKVSNMKCRLTGLHSHHQVPLKSGDI